MNENDNIRKLTRLEQLEYMVDFYQQLIARMEIELNKYTAELEEEKTKVLKKGE